MNALQTTPSDEALEIAVNEILKGCDIASMTLKAIKQQLEERFDCPLPESKSIIRSCLERFMDTNEDEVLYAAKIKCEEGVEEEEEEEEEVAPTQKKRGSNIFV